MSTRKVGMLGMIILTLFLASLASKGFAAATVGSVNVVPSATTVGLGQTVTVNVTISNVGAPGLFSYQLTLTYNNTLLNATTATIPVGHFLTPAVSGNIFVVDPGTINQDSGNVTFAASLLGTEAGKTGNGTLVTVTFVGLLQGNSTLQLPDADLILIDSDVTTITGYTINSSTVQIIPEFTVAVMLAALMITSAAVVVLRKRQK